MDIPPPGVARNPGSYPWLIDFLFEEGLPRIAKILPSQSLIPRASIIVGMK
jgi:hypothetical protein